MLPATLAQDVKKQVRHYLEATFPMRDPEFEQALSRFINDPENGLFKGPWLQIRRPFRLASDNGEKFFDLAVPFTPFKHQWLSWQRLSSKASAPQSTIVTTGTGSGKTECFLYPVLDHCLRQREAGKSDGIKAIVLYPMNALAADQAGRFAEEIMKSEQLSHLLKNSENNKRKALVTVGLYTGRMQPDQEDKSDNNEPGTYTEVQILPAKETGGKPAYVAVTNRAAMQKNPPDILLTNYKMLDYLLMRPKDQAIWRFNTDPSLLQYLVLDELHTYDGAQGADVACLIRRLKARLDIEKGKLCVVGTSATVAGGDDENAMGPVYQLCDFAQTLFEEEILPDAIIQEDRYSVAEIVRALPEEAVSFHPNVSDYIPRDKETAEIFTKRIAEYFTAPQFPLQKDSAFYMAVVNAPSIDTFDFEKQDANTQWAIALGEWLRGQPLFHTLLTLTEDGVVDWLQLLTDISKRDFIFRGMGDLPEREAVLMAFLALVSQARELRSGRAFPLVPTQVQFWIRELRRIGLVVSESPVFSWLDQNVAQKKQLPVVHCTECGEASWVALADPNMTSEIQQTVQGFAVDDDPQRIYKGWGFDGSPSEHLVTLSRWPVKDAPVIEGGQQELEMMRFHLAPNSLVLRQGPGACPLTGEATFAVKIGQGVKARGENEKRVGQRICPHCQTEDTLMFVGSRAATIASVSMDEVFGSTLNSDPKLLAFTDSVQDASHRAGFFSSRTYRFTLRTALQHVIDDAGDIGLPLLDVGEKLIDFWSEAAPGKPGSEAEAIACLLPPDLREYPAYLDFRNSANSGTPPAQLLEEVKQRLTWEAVSEFGLMQSHGRTMESQSSSTLGWDPMVITQTINSLRLRLPGISPALESVADENFQQWIYGILHRARMRGGLYHPFLDAYAKNAYWGKYPFNKVIPGRETYPSAGKYRPRLLVNQSDRYHDYMLAPSRKGSNAPWQLVWAKRALKTSSVDDATLLDLLALLLEEAVSNKLLLKVHDDNGKGFYALNPRVVRLYSTGQKLQCSVSGETIFRPEWEVKHWVDKASMSYRAGYGTYQLADLCERERYYQRRYRKGALRRVFAHEHTGLLTTEERENLELQFGKGGRADDPNVLTATSTLEMGIDIGDLSTTMLCSVPPTVASYLQRIGRAGRSTGTALVLSVINQRPHDLFFFARPNALLNGDVEAPGVWLDAAAVLVRQYLAFCFDQGVKAEIISALPSSSKQLIDEVVVNQAGNLPDLMSWVTLNEASLQEQFVQRFALDIQSDTEERFRHEAASEKLSERINQAAQDFNEQKRLLENAKKRLQNQIKEIDAGNDEEAKAEIEREQKILRARTAKLGEISALEILTEFGLLPNYAFPERGVRFSGSTFNKHLNNQSSSTDKKFQTKTFDIVRSASSALRELAPSNKFYTHSHVFDVQQLEIGGKNQPLIESWAVCGQCGYMTPSEELSKAMASPVCPQCSYDVTWIGGLRDGGQQRACLPFHRSQAISYMEYYDSLSADNKEERENEIYKIITSFDHTLTQSGGAVGDDDMPFGIEYRPDIQMREINTGYYTMPASVDVGNEQKVPEGFELCADCGVAVGPNESRKTVNHRRSCAGRRASEVKRQKGQEEDAYRWEKTWLYRELRSEAIRLLLPEVEQSDLDTLEACIYLGMRLRFQGDPAHLMVRSQAIPHFELGLTKNYLILLDAVPGGTGFLKALYQQKDEQGRAGEGIVEVLTLARNALETCDCNAIVADQEESDGCYKCIRTYHMQHRSANISRDRGVSLLTDLLDSASKRKNIDALNEINTDTLLDSVLEKRFVEKLKDWVRQELQNSFEENVLVNGKKGFRFIIRGQQDVVWELEMQPLLGPGQGVSIQCNPDFLLRCDVPSVKPIAIFLDGFEPHAHPGKPESRLTDDVQKRRSILDSNNYHVWSLSWDDLELDEERSRLSFIQPVMLERLLKPKIKDFRRKGLTQLAGDEIASNPWVQLKSYMLDPNAKVWGQLAEHLLGSVLYLLAGRGFAVDQDSLVSTVEMWRNGYNVPPLKSESSEAWVWASKLAFNDDVLLYAQVSDIVSNDFSSVHALLRLDDSEDIRSDRAFKIRWRQFMGLFNWLQFMNDFSVSTTSEASSNCSPELVLKGNFELSTEWTIVHENVLPALASLVTEMAENQAELPELEYYADGLPDDAFAEMAWVRGNSKIVFLVGDQTGYVHQWQSAGFNVFTDKDINNLGSEQFVSQLPKYKDGN
jgi:DEAD/DEAH box helicase domain-containing protein